jgi:hypothetical protein
MIRESFSAGNLPRSLRAPIGAFKPALNGLGCASPSFRAGPNSLEEPWQVRFSSRLFQETRLSIPLKRSREEAMRACPREALRS